jgi:uncharacterized protein YhaN
VHLTGWHVDAFGVLRDVGVRGLPPGLVVLQGPNAAGKSTLLAFIRRTLFGHPHGNRRGVNHYLPPEGDRRGGRLFLDADGEVVVERHAGPGGGVRVVVGDGRVGGESTIAELTGGCDEQLFNAVFAFDLADLADDGLGDEAVRDRLFSAGVRGAGRSARAVRERLEADARALWTPRSRTAPIDELQAELAELDSRLADARRIAAGHPQRREEERTAERRVEELDGRLEALARLEQLGVRIDAAAERAGQLEDEHAEVVRSRAELNVDDDLEEVADEVLRLEAERAAQRDRLARLEQLEGERLRCREVAAEALAALGDGWDEARLDAVDASVETRAQLGRWREDLEWATREAHEADRTLESGELAVQQARRREDRARAAVAELPAPPRGEVERRRDLLAQLRAAMAEADAADHARQATRRREDGPGPQVPGWVVPVAGGLAFLLAAGGVWAALVGAIAVTLLLGVVAVALLAAAVAARRPRRRPHTDDPVAADRASFRAVRAPAGLAAELGLPPRPSFADVEGVGVELERADRRRTELDRRIEAANEVSAERADVEAEVVELRERARAAHDELAELERAWADWCAKRELDPTARPAAVSDLLAVVDRARDQRQRLADVVTTIHEVESEVVRFAGQVDDAFARAGRPRTGANGRQGRAAQLPVLAELAETVRESRTAGAEARRLEGRLCELATEQERQHSRHEALLAEGRRLLGQLDPDVGPAIKGEGGVWSRAEVAARRRALAVDRDRAFEALVEARRRSEEVETSEQVAELDQRRHTLLARRDGLVHEWRVATVAGQLVGQTLEGFERDRQPGVLRAAGTHFAEVTDHAYLGLVQQGEQLLVVDAQERTWGVDTLSRGTTEQLYLCLRLALAEDLASRRRRLPLVMDDVLVNFDPDRARQVAGLLAHVARDGQLLYFTCQPHTTELLREAGAAAVYDLPAGGGAPCRRIA